MVWTPNCHLARAGFLKTVDRHGGADPQCSEQGSPGKLVVSFARIFWDRVGSDWRVSTSGFQVPERMATEYVPVLSNCLVHVISSSLHNNLRRLALLLLSHLSCGELRLRN